MNPHTESEKARKTEKASVRVSVCVWVREWIRVWVPVFVCVGGACVWVPVCGGACV